MTYVIIQDELVLRQDATISFDDRGYYFGDGIYEVIPVYNGRPFALNEHFQRFLESAQKIDMPLAAPVDKIKSLACSLIEQNNLANGYVYIQMTRGVAERNHLYERDLTSFLTGFTKEMTFSRDKHNGISLYATEDIRWLRCDIKTLNLLGNIMAKRKAADHNCEEALQHRGDVVTEGSSSNIFMVKNKDIYTHPANNFILNGITRQVVISLAGDLKYNVIEEAFSLDDIEQADEVFITSTSAEVTPVSKIQGTIESSYPVGPVAKTLQEAFYRTTNL
ncbi:D-amino-acid transaminase [Bacillus sp. FJAT-44742]|uniref:D-amino-acid transaminase n=1 Tax=Bacillus sp. FJAT-44742 TaxID=2014005 RepID=UPI000C24E130|nr:D-amino-acid transaminase [Bacillus sp. FJAT-44742]